MNTAAQISGEKLKVLLEEVSKYAGFNKGGYDQAAMSLLASYMGEAFGDLTIAADALVGAFLLMGGNGERYGCFWKQVGIELSRVLEVEELKPECSRRTAVELFERFYEAARRVTADLSLEEARVLLDMGADIDVVRNPFVDLLAVKQPDGLGDGVPPRLLQGLPRPAEF